jgi:hypothetical protein
MLIDREAPPLPDSAGEYGNNEKFAKPRRRVCNLAGRNQQAGGFLDGFIWSSRQGRRVILEMARRLPNYGRQFIRVDP